MNLLYVSKYQFKKCDDKTYALPAYDDLFWSKYLDTFDRVDVLAEDIKKYLNVGALAEITDTRISVEILPPNTSPEDFINDRKIKKHLEEKIKAAEAILIKPSCRKGMMAIKIAEKYNKPYMIELTGDLSLTLRNHPNILKRIYNPFLHKQILRAIKNCKYGLYVTKEHLQKVYPIAGKQCGCTDTVLPYVFEEALYKRIEKIDNMTENCDIHIGMVASYHDKRKGLDTAIKTLSLLKDRNVFLHVLGIGTEHDRKKWLSFAKRHGVYSMLKFDPPLAGVENVLKWYDGMDLCILPSRSEGLPRCIVESISRACPNITSNVCGMPELVSENWVHNPSDYKKLAQLIVELINNKELMKTVAKESFNRSKDYQFDVLKTKRSPFLAEFKEYCNSKKKKDMQLLYISTFMFHKDADKTLSLPSCSDSFFQKYLDVFSSVRVLAEEVKGYLSKSALVEMNSPHIEVEILPANTLPKDFKNDHKLKKLLTEEIRRADAILIKPASRRGMMAIKIAEKLNKPYMIEMTGDIHNALSQSPSLIKRMYSPILYRQMKRAISKCEFALYVSESYLQSKYPIKGVMCGCSDVVLEPSANEVLTKRLSKIDAMDSSGIINLALIGFYQGNGKGVDTALRALSKLPENYHLSVLGNGTEENRKKWYEYGKERGVSEERLHFPEPLPSSQAVLHWLEDFDFFVLPTRSEGFCRVIVEAISVGIPSFATNICSIPEQLPSECLFELDDDEKLAELLSTYCSDKELMKKAAKINFENAKKYDFKILKERRNSFLRDFKNYCLNKK